MKNVTPYKLDPAFSFSELAEGLSHEDYFSGKHRFQPCGKLDALKVGFVSNPAGEFVNSSYAGPNLTYAEHLTLRIAEKKIPAQAINDHVTERVKKIEESESRKVTRKERSNLKDEAYFELLPHAFVTRTDIEVTIVEHALLVLVGTSSARIAELVCSKIREVLGSFPVTPLESENLGPFLLEGYEAGDPEPMGDVKIENPKTGEKVSFKNFEDDEEIVGFIGLGFRVTEMRVGYLDQFTATYTTGRVLKSLKLAEELISGATSECETAADSWRATKAIETNALTQFYARNI